MTLLRLSCFMPLRQVRTDGSLQGPSGVSLLILLWTNDRATIRQVQGGFLMPRRPFHCLLTLGTYL